MTSKCSFTERKLRFLGRFFLGHSASPMFFNSLPECTTGTHASTERSDGELKGKPGIFIEGESYRGSWRSPANAAELYFCCYSEPVVFLVGLVGGEPNWSPVANGLLWMLISL
ncbi:hypothetical protein [Pseudomonas sp. LRF_L74]|uniref:hypothetical protein n=1 Tax=Pseudomonas sp. LRF_L74 TaxID=3369422 RepID=UPI003F5F73DF